MLYQLLDENRSLKGTVELLQHCREIGSHLEFEPLGQTSLRVLSQVTGAKGGLFVWREAHEKTFRIVATYGITKREGKSVTDQMIEYPRQVEKRLSVATWIEDGSLMVPYCDGPTLLLSLRMEGKPYTAILLGFPRGVTLDEAKREQIRLLVQQTEITLGHAYRFERARNLAFLDDLTGLYNTRYLEHFVDQELKRAVRQHYLVSFLFVDLDFFKQVNDRFGHMIGSRLLVAVGQELHSIVRDIDVIIRFGGDEFVLVLINTPLAGARQVAERIRTRIHNRPFLEELGVTSRYFRLSASIGISTFPEHGENKESLLRLADEAMYRAKAISRNAISIAQVSARPLAATPTDIAL